MVTMLFQCAYVGLAQVVQVAADVCRYTQWYGWETVRQCRLPLVLLLLALTTVSESHIPLRRPRTAKRYTLRIILWVLLKMTLTPVYSPLQVVGWVTWTYLEVTRVLGPNGTSVIGVAGFLILILNWSTFLLPLGKERRRVAPYYAAYILLVQVSAGGYRRLACH